MGAREKLYIGNSYVIAMSNTILVSKVENNICLEGPGYVFLEGPSSPAQYQNVHNLLLLKIFTITVLVTIFLLLTTWYLFNIYQYLYLRNRFCIILLREGNYQENLSLCGWTLPIQCCHQYFLVGESSCTHNISHHPSEFHKKDCQ